MDRIPEGGNYGWDAETSGRSSQRHRGCATDAKSEAQLIGALPDNTMRQERYGNAGAVESVESQKQVSHFPASPFSGSRRIGIELPFQAHGVLESILDFRLIYGLENAVPHHRWPPVVGQAVPPAVPRAQSGALLLCEGTPERGGYQSRVFTSLPFSSRCG